MPTLNKQQERKQIIQAAFYPFVFLCLMWIIKGTEWLSDSSFAHWGLWPRHTKGLIGIASMPFLHGSWQHLVSNSLPFLLLSSTLFFFYKDLAWRVFIALWLISGLWLWVGGGAGYHIGASAIVYGLAAFLFFSGIIRKNSSLLRITLIVSFLYGGLVWGFFPEFFPKKNISWEGHLFGFLAGMLLAFFFRKQGPPDDQKHWDDSDVPDDEDAYWRSELPSDQKALDSNARPTNIRYHIRSAKK